MIIVHRLNGKEFVINAELIRSVESTPDTMITMVGNEKLMVQESVQDILRKVVQYKREIFNFPNRQV
ncbi:MAG: flagellar FlbD family protein [Bdellovibrionota bacterium]